MSANGLFNLPTFNSLPSDPASSGFGSSSQTINPIFLNTNSSLNPPTSHAWSSGILSTPSTSTVDSSFLGDFVPLNNNAFSAQPPQSLTDVEQNARVNMLPSQSTAVVSGSKRKADLDSNISGRGPTFKKPRPLPVDQEESRAGAQALPPGTPAEIADIDLELNGLKSALIKSSAGFPPCFHLLTTVVLRNDVPMKEERFYPYLWFPGRAPYLLKDEDFPYTFPVFHVGEMQKALRRLGVVGGALGLTASRQLVIFFDVEARSMFQDTMKEMMQDTQWQGSIETLGQNNIKAFMGQQIDSDSNPPQSVSDQPDYQTERRPRSGPSSHFSPNYSTTTHQQRHIIPHYGPYVHSQPIGQSSDSAVAESSASFQTTTPRHPVADFDPFILVSNDTAKRRRNSPSPMSVPDTSETVSGPSMSYPSAAVFAETHTKESFPHPQNKNAAAAAPKPKNRRRRAPVQGPKGQRGKRRVRDPEPPQSQAGPSGTTTPEPQAQHVYRQQDSASIFPQENTQAYTQHYPGYAGNVEEPALFNSEEPASLSTHQLAAPPGYARFESLDILGGGLLDLGGDYQLSSLPGASNWTCLTAVDPSANQGIFPNFATGYETGGATTSQTSDFRLSDPVANKCSRIPATLTGDASDYTSVYPRAACDQGPEVNTSAFESSHSQPQSGPVKFDRATSGHSSISQPSEQPAVSKGHSILASLSGPNVSVGFDAPGGFNLPILTDEEYQFFMAFFTSEQNHQPSYLSPVNFVPDFSAGFPENFNCI